MLHYHRFERGWWSISTYNIVQCRSVKLCIATEGAGNVASEYFCLQAYIAFCKIYFAFCPRDARVLRSLANKTS